MFQKLIGAKNDLVAMPDDVYENCKTTMLKESADNERLMKFLPILFDVVESERRECVKV